MGNDDSGNAARLHDVDILSIDLDNAYLNAPECLSQCTLYLPVKLPCSCHQPNDVNATLLELIRFFCRTCDNGPEKHAHFVEV